MSHSKITTFTLITVLGLFGVFRATAAPEPLTPGSNDGSIAYITARLLEEFHYTQHPFDTEISEKFYDGYLDGYDPDHLYFLQSDIAEFSRYRTNLDTLTLGAHGQADVAPAYKIFERFKERLHQRVAYVDELLKRDNFKFTSNEEVSVNRKDAPYPKNLDEAKRIWREKLMGEFLQLKMDGEKSPGTATNQADIAQTLQRRYERELRQCDELDSGDVLQAYLDSLAHAYDPHSDYMNNEHATDFSISMSLALFGIGAELTSEDGYCQIESLVPGGPAWKSNQLKKDDKIIAVAQGNQPSVDVVDMELSRIVQLIRGKKGTEVRLTIIPADNPTSRKTVSLVRDEINIKDQQAKALLIDKPNGNGGSDRIGIIDVPTFYAPVDSSGVTPAVGNHVSVDVAKLVQKLTEEKASGIILDLRRNPGGSLEEAIQFVGLFVTNGPVVLTRSPDNGDMEDGNDHAPDIYHGPLIVLVDRLSASASEIVAAALQDYGRALIVGDTSTFGKGTVQNLDYLRPFVWAASDSATNDPGLVKITIRKFYRINGASTQLKGVVPDIVLPDPLSYSEEIGEDALPNALPWDTIPSTNYVRLNDVMPYLPTLQRDSAMRVATNRDFAYVRQDIAELQKLQSEKSETLNERKAWDEKESLDAERDARDKEIASRPIPDEKMYEITVADTEKPGLPAPVILTKTPAPDPGAAYTAIYPTNSINVVPLTNSVPPDAMLDEAERIMEDYILLDRAGGDAVASHE
ncbi:MAG TPA: carboxy terminal-processing peptidase [Candidatus Sulfotelmatobacter sp.]|nr:carboxy terminal-processing peptidase [Candidatus Sulfotelmatobacter sp.]